MVPGVPEVPWEGGAEETETVKERVLLSVPQELVAEIEMLVVPVLVGVPEMVGEEKVRPVGRLVAV